MGIIVLLLFCLMLTGSIILEIPLVLALLAGLGLFLVYGLIQGHSLRSLGGMALSGVKTIGGILITFIIIGTLTALWRASGTVPTIVCYASGFISPGIFIVITFILNSLISTLTGTAFGTAATMGIICMSISTVFGISPVWVGGAILAGAYTGDRCSPVSTSALLVSVITDTNIYDNIGNMLRTFAVPFALTCGIYLIAGRSAVTGTAGVDVWGLFGQGFKITWIALLPAAAVLVLAILRVSVRTVLITSDVLAFLVAYFVQGESIGNLVKYMIAGYKTDVAELASMINGGGVVSMLMVTAIVCVASTYSGIFDGTGLLDPLKKAVVIIAAKTNEFIATFVASVVAVCVGCNQTLAIMLTKQMCTDLDVTKEEMALNIEDTATVFSAVIPWSIAGSVVLTTVGAPKIGMATACYLYLLPVCRAVWSIIKKK